MHIPIGGGTLCKSKKECITSLKKNDFPTMNDYIRGIAELDTILKKTYAEESGKFCTWWIGKTNLKGFLKDPTFPAGNEDSLGMTRTNAPTHFIKLWIIQEDGKYLKEPKLIWTKKKGQINQKQKPEPTLEETIKKYLKKQRI